MAEREKMGHRSHITAEENNCVDLHPEMNSKLVPSLESENIKLHVIIRTTRG